MNASFGLIRAPEQRIRNKNEKHRIMAEIALDQIEKIKMSEKI